MCNNEPNIKDAAVYTVMETCRLLEICKDTLTDRRRKGLIAPINPLTTKGFKYSGAAIKRLWRIEMNLIPGGIGYAK